MIYPSCPIGLPAQEKIASRIYHVCDFMTRSAMESSKAADDCQNKEKMSEFHEPFIVL